MNKELKNLILIVAVMIITAVWVNHAYGEGIWERAKAEQARLELEARNKPGKTESLLKELTDLLDADTLTYTDYTKAMGLVRKINKLGKVEIAACPNVNLIGFMARLDDKCVLDSIPRNVDCTLVSYYIESSYSSYRKLGERETKSTYVNYDKYSVNFLEERIYFKDGSEFVDIKDGWFDDIVYTKSGQFRLRYNASFKKGCLKKITFYPQGYLPFVIEVK